MKIEKVAIHLVRLPMIEPFRISSGDVTAVDTIIVQLFSEGLVGIGESSCDATPIYSYETTQTVLHIIRDFIIPATIGQSFSSADAVSDAISLIRGHNMAKSGIEMAMWDLIAKSKKTPLYQLIGGERPYIESGVSIGLQDTESALFERIEKYTSEGYRRIKIKIKHGHDERLVAAVRKRFGTIQLMVDANSAYTLDDESVFIRLDPYGLMMIEQPLGYNDIVDHSRLQKKLKTPICLDESIKYFDDARQAIELGSCRIINIKVGRVGGLSESKRIHDYCRARNIPVWCGSLLESGVGEAHNLAISTLPGFTIPGDVAPTGRYFTRDILREPMVMDKNGRQMPSNQPGVGVELDMKAVNELTFYKQEFVA